MFSSEMLRHRPWVPIASAISAGTLSDSRTDIQQSTHHLKTPLIIVSTISIPYSDRHLICGT